MEEIDVVVNSSDLDIAVSVENSVEQEIIEIPVEKRKFGVSIDDVFGNVDVNGEYVPSTEPFTFDATSVVNVPSTSAGGNDYFAYKFYYNRGLTGTVDLSNMTGISGSLCLERTFFGCVNLKKVITPKPLSDPNSQARFNYTFGFCESLEEIVFSDPIIGGAGHACFYYGFQSGNFSETKINFGDIVKLDYYGLYGAFRYCELPDEIRFTSLENVLDSNAFRTTFAEIKSGGKRFYFPAFSPLIQNTFGTSSSNLTWYKSTLVEEIHFRADVRSVIEQLYGYSSKFGATNATIYFDL